MNSTSYSFPPRCSAALRASEEADLQYSRVGEDRNGVLSKTSDPERARLNLLERDAMFTRRLHEEAKALELETIVVDSTMTVDELTGRVTEAFGL
jgi:hypothetical protein